eukprot:2352903-Prymnesium_polylepis.1
MPGPDGQREPAGQPRDTTGLAPLWKAAGVAGGGPVGWDAAAVDDEPFCIHSAAEVAGKQRPSPARTRGSPETPTPTTHNPSPNLSPSPSPSLALARAPSPAEPQP